ncbi:MAG TPA: 16S rRNA (cytosine(1402)-N(4))-methyltransferase RsmH, partial [Candidatus Saccharimonadales bacterium]|nr:16S rRNA (cytosine(1402)-N(4))-methyltransferase RsmH [Candidatus Saccharimonadales bacterium]
MSEYHISVLLQEAIEALLVKQGEKYIDSTLGGGGHTSEILKQGGKVLGIDADTDAIETVRLRITDYELQKRLTIAQGNFRDIKNIAEKNGFEEVCGILFDLGVSSYQLDKPEKGFSFQYEAPLDMRMDTGLSVTAADLIHVLNKEELAELFIKYGEEQYTKRIVSAIIEARKIKRIETTKQLAELIARVYPRGEKKIHPATKVFQALRIAVNDELNSLKEAVTESVNLLKPGGRLVIISFHSLEDRIVKNAFLEFAEEKQGKIITKKPIIPTYEEIETNKRSRSAKMRIFEKA